MLIWAGVVVVSTSGVSVVFGVSGDATSCVVPPVLGVSFQP